jgi:hypothetical protein
MSMTPHERKAAERRIEEIKGEIEAVIVSKAPDDERVERWRFLLARLLHLQTKLGADAGQPRP